MFMKKLKSLGIRAIQVVKNAGAFSIGMFIGVCYGSVVASITAYVMLSQP